MSEERRNFRAMEIAMYAAVWTAFSMMAAAAATAFTMLKLMGMGDPAHEVRSEILPKQVSVPVVFVPSVKPVRIPIRIPVRVDAEKPPKIRLPVPVELNVTVSRSREPSEPVIAEKDVPGRTTPAAEKKPGEVSMSKGPNIRKVEKKRVEDVSAPKWDAVKGIGIPPPEGDPLPPPKRKGKKDGDATSKATVR